MRNAARPQVRSHPAKHPCAHQSATWFRECIAEFHRQQAVIVQGVNGADRPASLSVQEGSLAGGIVAWRYLFYYSPRLYDFHKARTRLPVSMSNVLCAIKYSVPFGTSSDIFPDLFGGCPV